MKAIRTRGIETDLNLGGAAGPTGMYVHFD
jgi:hypothetical protein